MLKLHRSRRAPRRPGASGGGPAASSRRPTPHSRSRTPGGAHARHRAGRAASSRDPARRAHGATAPGRLGGCARTAPASAGSMARGPRRGRWARARWGWGMAPRACAGLATAASPAGPRAARDCPQEAAAGRPRLGWWARDLCGLRAKTTRRRGRGAERKESKFAQRGLGPVPSPVSCAFLPLIRLPLRPLLDALNREHVNPAFQVPEA